MCGEWAGPFASKSNRRTAAPTGYVSNTNSAYTQIPVGAAVRRFDLPAMNDDSVYLVIRHKYQEATVR